MSWNSTEVWYKSSIGQTLAEYGGSNKGVRVFSIQTIESRITVIASIVFDGFASLTGPVVPLKRLVTALGATTRFKRGMLQVVDQAIGLFMQELRRIKVIVDLRFMNHSPTTQC